MLHGSAWMIGLRWALRLTGLVSTFMLARLLTPADFGLVGVAMLFVGALEILNQTGQKLSIIRHPNPLREHYDTAWTFSVIVGLVIAAVIFLTAPLTRFYFNDPRAVPVMQCLALRAAIGGFENIGVVNFRRDMQFDRFFLYNVYPKLISFVVTLVLAFTLRNYWALVAGMLTGQLALNALSYVVHPYRPRFSLARLDEIWNFSIWTLIKTIGGYLNLQVDQLVVAGISGAASMGRYSVASDLAASPSQELNDPMVAVLYPVMARIQGDSVRLRALYLQVLSWSAVICVSTSVGVTMVAHDLVQTLLGAKWGGVEPLIGWLALSAGALGLSSGAYATFDALGRPYLSARMQWVRLVFLTIALIPVGILYHNLEAIAAARFAMTMVFIPTLFVAVGRVIGASPADYVASMWRPIVAGAAMSSVLALANLELAPGSLRLLLDVVLGACVFAGTLLALWAASGRPPAPEKDVAAFLAQRWVRIEVSLFSGRRSG